MSSRADQSELSIIPHVLPMVFDHNGIFAGHISIVLPRAKAESLPPANYHEPGERVHRPKHLGGEPAEVRSVDHHRTEETDCQVAELIVMLMVMLAVLVLMLINTRVCLV